MRKILLSLAVAFGMQAGAQTIDTILHIHKTDSTVLNISVTDIDSLTFSYDTLGACNGLTSLTYNGYTYDLVEIGGQCWFKENLQTTTYRDGTPINYPGTDNTAWSNDTTGAYAWYDNDSTTYDSIYGKLYNWYAVENPARLCPTGWHVPTDSEWSQLVIYLDPAADTACSVCNQSSIAGIMMKDTGTIYWTNPNFGATNISGFSGLPGGYRQDGGLYANVGSKGNWWSSSSYQHNTNNAMCRNLSSNNGTIQRFFIHKRNGYSIRCLRD